MSSRIIDTIKKMKNVRKELAEATRHEQSLFVAPLSDVSLIPHIVDLFCKYGNVGRGMEVEKRKVLIFIVILLYSPRKIFGKNMSDNVNRMLSKILNVKRSVISDNSSGLLVEFEHYEDFRNDVSEVYDEIVKQLLDEGVMS